MSIAEQARKKIDEYYNLLDSKGFGLGSIEKRQYNFEFSASKNASKEKLKIQVYFGKKGVKTVLQGNTESELYKEINGLVNNQTVMDFANTKHEDFEEYIGSDETGKGDIFGPLIVCAFYCGKNDTEQLIRSGVKDSKELSAYQIKETASYLLNNFKDKYNIVVISPEKYNVLYDKFRNLNKMLNWAHSTALSNLTAIHPCKNIIVDKFSNEQVSINNGNSSDFNIVQTHKAERYAGVAAASIIARYMFDKWYSEHPKFNLLKGASDETVKIAKKIFDDYGVEELKKVAKLHFKPISKLLG